MRAATLVLLAIALAVPLSGCVVAAIPAIAGAAVVNSESKRKERRQSAAAPQIETPVAPPIAPPSAPPPPPPPPQVEPASDTTNHADFAPLLAHVRKRVTLWREGAPINSLALDDRQTVLNPVAIGCARRPPTVVIDLDDARSAATPGGATDVFSATPGWAQTAGQLRADAVAIVWITDRPPSDAAPIRAILTMTGLDAAGADRLITRADAGVRKQLMRQEIARETCVLAVVGDKRGDADEAYDFLRDPDARLPIDSNWGEGWFLLPPPLQAKLP